MVAIASTAVSDEQSSFYSTLSPPFPCFRKFSGRTVRFRRNMGTDTVLERVYCSFGRFVRFGPTF